MKIIGNLLSKNQTSEDYFYSVVIDSQAHPEIKDIQFQYAISELPADRTVEVDLFCSADGVSWTNMGLTKTYNHDNTVGGVYDFLDAHVDEDERFVKFGFNCNGDNFDALLFGAVIDITPAQ